MNQVAGADGAVFRGGGLRGKRLKRLVARALLGRQVRLLRYARPQWRSLLVVVVTMVLSVGTTLLRPWPIKILVDQVLGSHPLPPSTHRILQALPVANDREGLLVVVCAALVLITVVGIVVQIVNNLASVIFSQRVTYNLAAGLFAHVQRLSLLFHSRQPTGDTIARVTGDTYCVQQLVTGALIPLLQSVVMIVGMVVILWHLSPQLTLVSVSVVPFLMLAVAVLSPPMKRRTRTRRDREGAMMSIVQETLSAVPAVQAFTREQTEDRRFRASAAVTVRAYVGQTIAQSWFMLAVGLVLGFGMAALIYVGGRLALDGTVTVGTIILFVLYLVQFYQPLNALASTASTFMLAAAQGDRVMELLEMPPDIQDAPDAQDVELKGEIRFEDVWFGYNADVPVSKGISLRASPGEVVAIVGPTGAGKTTLVSLLVRFFDPWSGQITIDGTDVRELRVHSLRQQVAIVLQDSFIFPFSVAENIAYGRPDATREQIEAAAVAANADDFIRQLPDGYDTVIGERGTTLSGGEKQRLAIARAFLKDAPILILDEPTSALDARTEARLLDSLERLMVGRTTLIIAHRLSTIRNADWILVMDDGEIVEAGGHTDLMSRDGMYASLYRQQMEIAQHEGFDDDSAPSALERSTPAVGPPRSG